MRIRDWSSDVCSSDLLAVHDIAEEGGEAGRLLLVCEACADLGGQIRKAAFPLLNLEPGAKLPGDCLGIGGGGTGAALLHDGRRHALVPAEDEDRAPRAAVLQEFSRHVALLQRAVHLHEQQDFGQTLLADDRKSTSLNSSH